MVTIQLKTAAESFFPPVLKQIAFIWDRYLFYIVTPPSFKVFQFTISLPAPYSLERSRYNQGQHLGTDVDLQLYD